MHPSYVKYAIAPQNWNGMNEDQKRKHLDKFYYKQTKEGKKAVVSTNQKLEIPPIQAGAGKKPGQRQRSRSARTTTFPKKASKGTQKKQSFIPSFLRKKNTAVQAQGKCVLCGMQDPPTKAKFTNIPEITGWIQCETCDLWFHLTCARGVNEYIHPDLSFQCCDVARKCTPSFH